MNFPAATVTNHSPFDPFKIKLKFFLYISTNKILRKIPLSQNLFIDSNHDSPVNEIVNGKLAQLS